MKSELQTGISGSGGSQSPGRTQSVRTFVFDCGRVITFDQDREIAGRMADIVGAPPEDFPRAYAADRGEYDRGTLDAAGYWGMVAARFGRTLGKDDLGLLVELDMDSWFTINPETVAIIRALKEKGHRLLILSNMNVEGRERMYGSARILDGEDWLGLFDDVLLSCDLGLIKPEPEIYRACIARSGAEPGECLFIDDVLANIEGARACGMMAVHFTDASLLASVLADEYGEL